MPYKNQKDRKLYDANRAPEENAQRQARHRAKIKRDQLLQVYTADRLDTKPGLLQRDLRESIGWAAEQCDTYWRFRLVNGRDLPALVSMLQPDYVSSQREIVQAELDQPCEVVA